MAGRHVESVEVKEARGETETDKARKNRDKRLRAHGGEVKSIDSSALESQQIP